VVLIPTVVGLATTISRIAGAAIGNLRCTDRTLQYGVSMLIAGFLVIISAHMYTFISIALVGAGIGALVGNLIYSQSFNLWSFPKKK